MRRVLCTMGLLVMGLSGCPKKGPTHPAELHENARPLMLWQVTKGDDAPDYLFGTCHVAVDLAESLLDAARWAR